ncbi:class F sortase [Salipaludibacillus sp. CUR1]|uniref:class F sortase n=1 Tax=Salipaludibacillus sp. CUR1 TaxID=2820003 RepID=UPI001E41FBF5|nr:class F sortase [Salipaludibacillus sp. CUR1]MCE7794043.1 class F sortase [Salipaludibacillus sp. CUR1]
MRFLSAILLTFILASCGGMNESSPEPERDDLTRAEDEAVTVSASEIDDKMTFPAIENKKRAQKKKDEPSEEVSSIEPSQPVEPVYSASSQGIIPDTIEIPALDVKADITQVGLKDDGAMEVPDDGDLVGWFNRGVKPGGAGNSVLAGHVDDRTGPAIFFDLKDLEIGDVVKVRDGDGTELTFEVKSREIYPYDDAPISKVFGPSSSRNLNLITCTGEFDRDQGTHRERLVVFTELIEETQT